MVETMSWRTVLFWLAAAGAVVYAVKAPNAEGFTNARILFFHLPCAFVTTGLIVLAAWLGWKYLKTGDAAFDARNTAAIELSLLFAVLTMATGVLFSRYEWGAWWNNDPRQTSFLVVLLLSAAGVALRAGLPDEQKSAKAAAAYSVATVLPFLFCIFALPRLLQSLHPSTTIVKNELSGPYWTGIALTLAVLTAAARTLYLERARLAELRYGHPHPLDDPDAPGADPRRPVAVPRVGAGEE
jgi:heme exporter protein C